ncbi:ABC transporter permease [Streptomyces drozdowiczii]|uniref:ABC transporter permease n=1 Tax=Streptomyces drozdowiczii TaxID=202862 RepID=UPI0027E2DE2B|nr:ABC transporter permease [Streptomyces drozdowiczii]
MILLEIIVVSGTLARSVQQRRRELALLRAVGATPRQVLRMIGGEAVLVGGIGLCSAPSPASCSPCCCTPCSRPGARFRPASRW